jgi:hypothetical protein
MSNVRNFLELSVKDFFTKFNLSMQNLHSSKQYTDCTNNYFASRKVSSLLSLAMVYNAFGIGI